jgi:predicted DNA-binding antitoxin AbrB/MazE fold protein
MVRRDRLLASFGSHEMTTRIRAKVHNGNLIPLEDLNLPEGEEVEVTIAETGKKDARAFRRSAGSWKGLVDAEKLIRDIYRDRLIATRRRPRL